MISRRPIVALAVVAGLLPFAAMVSAHAAVAVPPTVVAGPGAFLAGYATPTVVAQPSAALTFSNADIAPHNVVALDPAAPVPTDLYGPDTPACAAAGYAVGKCPLFWSATISAGQTGVNGTENVAAGKSYSFYCTVHPFSMRGTLIVSS
ncbi:MAG TPA: plastocyanin/azurin family copper-binding protein [Acidimicrobiales bacterium]|nr:plastocyanin/azurin family copper-binding protein [Acidimicrobiales bacterium]